MTVTTEEIGRWISDDRKHGVNVNSGVLSDMCCEIIRNRAKLEAAEKMAEALAFYADKDCSGYDVTVTDYGLSMEKGAIVLDAGDTAIAALAAWEAVK